MVCAQHEANLYASSLKEAYTKYGNLENFSLPTIALGEIELQLNYGVSDIDEKAEQYEVNFSELRGLLGGICQNLADMICTSFTAQIAEIEYEDKQTKSLIDDFCASRKLQLNFTNYINRRMLRLFQGNLSKLLDEDGDIVNDELVSIALRTMREALIANPDLKYFNMSTEGIEQRDEILVEIKRKLNAILPKITQDIKLKRKRNTPSIDVVINSEELSKLPEDALHSFKIRIQPQGVNMQIVEHDSEK